jgi:hypothetical protein
VVLDVLELTEFAWHDCYCEVSPPDDVIDDLFVVARGIVTDFVRAAGQQLAVDPAPDHFDHVCPLARVEPGVPWRCRATSPGALGR